MALTVLLSYRRTGWFGLLFALVLVALVSLRRSQRSLIMVPVFAAVAVGVSLISSARFGAQGGLWRFLPDVSGTESVSRQVEWGLAWNGIERNLILGGGPMAERLTNPQLFWDPRIVHNAGLFVLLKFGLIGFALLMALVVVAARCAMRAMATSSTEDHIALGVLATGPFVVLQAMSGTPLIEMRTVILCALFGALAVTISAGASSTSQGEAESARLSRVLQNEAETAPLSRT
jgi:O-antigen ligase